MKYHASSCYRRFQLDLGKIVSLAQTSVELSKSLQQAQEPTNQNYLSTPRSLVSHTSSEAKDLGPVKQKMSVFFVEQIARLLSKK